MYAVKTIKKVKNKKISFSLPKEFKDDRVEITIRPIDNSHVESIFDLRGSISKATADQMIKDLEDCRRIELESW